MFVSRGRQDLPSEQRTDTFTGVVYADPVVPGAAGVVVNNVTFAPAARTYWHTHGGGQLLLVLAGKGAVANRDGNFEFIVPGDSVWIPAGEEHWHGATADTYVVHYAVSVGSTNWLDEVTEDDYAILRPSA